MCVVLDRRSDPQTLSGRPDVLCMRASEEAQTCEGG